MTLGTNDENMNCTVCEQMAYYKVSVLVGAIWEVLLYKYSWRKVEVADNFVHSGKFQKVAASGKWWKVQKL